MTKQEQLEKLAQDIADICPDMVEDGCEQQCYTCLAFMLVMRGYGNIKEFAEKLKGMIERSIVECPSERSLAYNNALEDVLRTIDELVKEY